jgi:hypothetical protein
MQWIQVIAGSLICFSVLNTSPVRAEYWVPHPIISEINIYPIGYSYEIDLDRVRVVGNSVYLNSQSDL